ncbi:glycosyl transferase, group 2 [Vibrio ichthyoenteri ATCC 700023]|uniref:Glycosyl transferase, group 2 n=1 Tax=Vibrio ichthyoenteri ATCC 700023 TaxID=870968 RepID=F9S0G8_9VIBR|nr:glycosyltransferase [Vibrio ichthyoenteri]EGU43438.1 glycosyl transferase, group 2 [Vibrio ichthyoenteri ATCC 700023]
MEFTYAIIVPHFNSHQGLERLLQSVPVRNDIQLLIVDDNSEQVLDAERLAQKFPGLHLELFTNDTGVKGAGSARNVALNYVRSDYTLFADADDLFCSGTFELLDRVLSAEDITYFSPTSRCDVSGELSDRHHIYADLVRDYLDSGNEDIRYHFSVPWSKVFRTDFLQQHALYFDQVIASNDVMFSLVSGRKAASISVHPQEIYCVTRGKGTLTVNFKPAVVRSRYLVELKRIEYIAHFAIATNSTSLYKMVKNFHKVMSLGDVAHVVGLLFQRKITLVPVRTYYYLNNPKALLNRFAKKKQSLSSQKYQA